MSVNNSLSEKPEDGTGDLPDLYSRELMRKNNISSQPFQADDNVVGDIRGGYRDWKLKNGIDSSGRMVSSLGRALHNQGMIPQNDDDFGSIHYHNIHSNPSLNPNCSGRDQQYPNINSTHPPFNSYRGPLRQDSQNRSRPDTAHVDEGYNHQNRHNGDQYEVKCSSQCCANGYGRSVLSPKCYQNESNHRDVINQNAHAMAVHPIEYQIRNMETPHESQSNQGFDKSPCRAPDSCQGINHCQGFRPCHLPPTCHSCQSPKEGASRPESPRKNHNRKTEASIKKLYRILWLQNEQLGLLERQVSKLIEMNFQKESVEKQISKVDKSESTDAGLLKKIESTEVGVMVDLPCPHCTSNEGKLISSDSENDEAKKSVVDDSLTLNGAEIPVNRVEPGSPPISMHIDLQEYQDTSSSETEESDTSEEESESVGWTFYDNVVGQVNNMLKSAGSKKKRKKPGYKDEMHFAVHQLKRLGLDHDSNNPKRVTFEEGLREQQVNLRAQSEISMNFNALASKYLTSSGGQLQDISMCNVISSNTNMSLATLRYLERHHITNRDPMDALSKKSTGSKKKNRSSGDNALTNKFLDITAIRQQPKLLPKNV